MNESTEPSAFLVFSRGQWDADASPEKIQSTIDRFYVWIDGLADEGKVRRGQRLTIEGRVVARQKPVTDGPFGETKEVIGGYWFILARSLDEAAQIMSQNPCLERGLFFEIRPIDPERASAFAVTNETPSARRGQR
jgi:hypothetical protein